MQEELAMDARLFCCLMIPGVWAQTQYDATKRYCTSQLKANIPFYVQLITSVLHVPCCVIFIQVLQWQIVGAAIALNISYVLSMVLLDIWIAWSKQFE